MIRMARTALLAPLMVAGGLLTLTLGSTTVFAAASNHPQSSSRAHDHDRLDCDPGRVSVHHGKCSVVFTDKETKKEEHPKGQTVCFSVKPADAGSVTTASGTNCTKVGKHDKAFGTFTASGGFCGHAKIWATEPGEGGQTRHTSIRVTCKDKDATTTAALIPAGNPLPPSGGGWLLGVMGVSVALATGYAVRTRRWFALGRLAANQSA
jgi:hypothetical protein